MQTETQIDENDWRVPPQNTEAEQSVLGAMLIERLAVDKAMLIVDHTDFYRDAHQALFKFIVTLAERNEPVDFVTLHEALRVNGQLDYIGGIEYLTSLFNTVPTAANVEYYARIVKDKAIRRALIAAGMDVIALARSEDEEIAQVTDRAQQRVYEASGLVVHSSSNEAYDIQCKIYTDAGDRRDNPKTDKKMLGVRTGLCEVDNLMSGIQAPDMITVAATTGGGKTSFLHRLAINITQNENRPVLIFTREMSKEQCAARMLSAQCRVQMYPMQLGDMEPDEWQRMADAVSRMKDAPLRIDDKANTIRAIRTAARVAAKDYGQMPIIGIDYLQLLRTRTRSSSRREVVDELARDCKEMAVDLGTSVIALSQFSRETGKENREPTIFDLRESGEIENASDVIILLHPTGDAPDIVQGEFINKTKAIFGKHRNGKKDTVLLGYMASYSTFVNLDWAHVF